MKVCLEYLSRFMPTHTTANTESKDQKVIRMFNEINQNISHMNEINTLLKDRIIVLENDKTLLKDRIVELEDYNTKTKEINILLKDIITVLDNEIVQYKEEFAIVKDNVKMLNAVCLEPVIRGVATQIMNHFFPLIMTPPLGGFSKASLKNVNSPILNIVMSKLNCYPTDIDALINTHNRDSHLNIIELKKKVDEVRIIIDNSHKFSDELSLPLGIIANYEFFVSHFGNLKI